MRCFLCKKRMLVAGMSIRTRNQPDSEVDEYGNANFCPECTKLCFDAIDAGPQGGRAFAVVEGAS